MEFDPNNKDMVLNASLKMIAKEEADVFSYYIENDSVRDYVVNRLEGMGLKAIDAVSKKHIYVDLKVDEG